MQIIFTEHARFEMNRRQISEELVKTVITNPDQRRITRKGRVVLQSKYTNITEKKEMLLRVIGKEINGSFIVITVYKTSKIEKYWKEEIAK
ncbi:MAG: DUF4258 domain-containing protein [Syntrophaceae bacterium]|nr:DUF4258 domain-containing protein [Syntrophaceae bacterium]